MVVVARDSLILDDPFVKTKVKRYCKCWDTAASKERLKLGGMEFVVLPIDNQETGWKKNRTLLSAITAGVEQGVGARLSLYNPGRSLYVSMGKTT